MADVTVALTGVSATPRRYLTGLVGQGGVGLLETSDEVGGLSQPLTGVSATGAVGTLTPPQQPPDGSGYVTWTASADHDTTLLSYEVRVWDYPADTLAGSENVGKPTKFANGDCSADMSTLFGTLAAGNYTVSVASIDAGGTTDSEKSSAFSLPL